MNVNDTFDQAVTPALAILPPAMTSKKALVMMMAIGLQESQLIYREQMGHGPAHGLWQFELGTAASHGGIWGVYLHDASRFWLSELCKARGVPFNPVSIWKAIMTDDVLAAGMARLLLFTDPKPLPELTDVKGAWALYALRCWRPGKPHPSTWAGYHAAAVKHVESMSI